jgi:ADP-dependent NAD(P)H-hydrate dehydratase / NAD(P)H-hydrate epimerase
MGTLMKLVTREEMQEMDRMAIQERGIPSLALMENAGRGVAELIEKEFPRSQFPQVAVLCGKGNNGGDGFVVARVLRQAGYEVKVYLLAPEEEYKGDALVNLHRLSFPTLPLHTPRLLRDQEKDIRRATLLVDGIFGTGLDRPIRGFTAELIRFLNNTRRPMVAIDIPSGLCANTGRVLGEAVRADVTATLHLPKRGLALGPDAERAGVIRVIPIGIPPDLEGKIRRKEFLIVSDVFRDLFKPRKRNTHKGTYGHVLTVAGSRRKIGAALMTSRAALRAGAGLSTLALPECAYQKIDPKFSEVMFEPQQDDGEVFAEASFSSLLKLMAGKSSLAMGPGMGVGEGLRRLIGKILGKTTLPCVLDADALNSLSEDLTPLRKKHPPIVLTPHPGEMLRLTKKTKDALKYKREKIAIQFAQRYRVHLILKGYRSLVTTPDGSLFVNSTGNPGMATAGAGDVLTGILAGLMAQGLPFEKTVLAGIWIHGRAGDLAVRKRGEAGLVAWDIAEQVPSVLKELVYG